MCGRYTLYANLNRILTDFAAEFRPEYKYAPRYNIAPTQEVLAVRQAESSDARELVPLRWGLIPNWAKDEKIAYSTINARAETVDSKPAFRSAFKKRRCLIIADGWYEWKATGPKTKQPYRMHHADDRPFGLAGLWESWTHDGETIESCTIIVADAAAHLAEVHDRSPCIVQPQDYGRWLDSDFQGVDSIRAMLQSPSEDLVPYPVSSAVGNVRNQGRELVLRVD
jgi:putative SOS response-associated peptidase YedK